MTQFDFKPHHIDSALLTEEQQKTSQLRAINYRFTASHKAKKYFTIESVSEADARYAYRAVCLYEELLEFYAYLNTWSIKASDNEDAVERFGYDHELALEQEDDLVERISRVSFILDGLQELV